MTIIRSRPEYSDALLEHLEDTILGLEINIHREIAQLSAVLTLIYGVPSTLINDGFRGILLDHLDRIADNLGKALK